MNTAKKICESDEQGVVRVDVPIGRPGQRVEVLVVWDDVVAVTADHGDVSMKQVVGLQKEGDLARPPEEENARRTRLQRNTTWTEEQLREFQAELDAQRVVDRKLWE